MRLSNSVTVPKNVKGGPFGIFWHHGVTEYRDEGETL